MRAEVRWIAGGIASVAAHVLLLAILAWTTDPDAVDQQDVSEARLDLTSYEVDRSEAAEAPASGDTAAQASAHGATVGAAAVPVGTAQSEALPQATAPQVSPDTVAMAATPGAGAPTTALSATEAGSAAPPLPPSATGAVALAATDDAAAVALAPDAVDSVAEPVPSAVAASDALQEAAGAAVVDLPSLTALGDDVTASATPPPLPLAAVQSSGDRVTETAATATIAPAEVRPSVVLTVQPPRPRYAAAQAPEVILAAAAPVNAPTATQIAAAVDTTAAQTPDVTATPTAPVNAPTATQIAAAVDATAAQTPDVTATPAAPVNAPTAIRVAAVADTTAPTVVPSVAVLAAAAPRRQAARPRPPDAPRATTAALAANPAATLSAAAPLTPTQPVVDIAAAPPVATPIGERGKAALAWVGDGGGPVDPVSLAAIQAFMQPGDLAGADASAGQVRDEIEALLAAVPCARLQTSFAPETGQLELRGHVPDAGLRGPVLEALQAHVGDAIPVADNLLILPRPQCGALSGIVAIGLPQSSDQTNNPRVVGPDAHARVYQFTEGQRLEFDLVGPDYDAVFYVDYFDADGMVLHLQPNEYLPLEVVEMQAALTIGTERETGPSLNITVAPPFGQEIMVAMATSQPLYDGIRPIREPAEPYLEFIREQVAAARAEHADFKGEWVYFFVQTSAR